MKTFGRIHDDGCCSEKIRSRTRVVNVLDQANRAVSIPLQFQAGLANKKLLDLMLTEKDRSVSQSVGTAKIAQKSEKPYVIR